MSLVVCPADELDEVAGQLGPRHDVVLVTEAEGRAGGLSCAPLAPGEVWFCTVRPDCIWRWRTRAARRPTVTQENP